MATSEIQICNSALSKLGVEQILNFSDPSKAAKLCKNQYPIKRDELMRSHPWNFAMARVELGPLAETPVFRWQFQFQLPADVARVWQTDFERETLNEWTVEGDRLMCDVDGVKILYSKKVTDVTKFDGAFVEVLALSLAADLAYPLVQSTSLKDSILAELQIKLRDARSFDAQEGFFRNVPEASTFINSRF